MAKSTGVVNGNSVKTARGRKHPIVKGGKFDSRKVNKMTVEFILVDGPGEKPSSGSGAIKYARITKVLK